MAKTDPNDFLLNTDYEMDKIIYFLDTKIEPNEYGYATVSHSLGFAPLITGVWSKNADFSTPHHFSLGAFADPDFTKYIVDTVQCEADENKITFSLLAGTIYPQTVYPFYVRIMGFEPSDSHRKLPKTSQNAKQFILNTDYNYLKLFKKGVENITIHQTIPQPTADPITITHNLGYRPQALFWAEDIYNNSSVVYQFDMTTLPSTTYDDYYGTITTPKQCIETYPDKFIIRPIIPQTGDTHKLHYRIYHDEA